MKTVIQYLVCCLSLCGCITTQRAINKLETAHELANICATHFPLNVSDVDSSEYVKAKDRYDSMASALHVFDTGGVLTHRYIDTVTVTTNYCDSILTDQVNRVQLENISLRDFIRSNHNFPPIYKKIIDSYGNQALRDQLYKSVNANTNLSNQIASLSEQKKKADDRARHWVGLASITWALIAVLIIGYVWAKVK
jgi:hypothetical protein